MELVTKLCSNFAVVRLCDCIEIYASVKAGLRKKGELIEDFDILIGSAAIARQLTMVSDNEKHLSRLPLTVENWKNG